MRSRSVLFPLFAIPRAALALAAPDNGPTFQDALAERVAAWKEERGRLPARTGGCSSRPSCVSSRSGSSGARPPPNQAAPKPDVADPVAAIVDFQQQLNARGIELLLVPVPPKAALYPEKIGLESHPMPKRPCHGCRILRRAERGVDVLDLAPLRAQPRELSAARIIARPTPTGRASVARRRRCPRAIRTKLRPSRRQSLHEGRKEVNVNGDLVTLVGGGQARPGANRGPANFAGGKCNRRSEEPGARAGRQPHAGLPRFADGSGLARPTGGGTRLRARPHRHARLRRHGGADQPLSPEPEDPEFLAKKKIIVWCFAAREFTEADQGWVVQPIAP